MTERKVRATVRGAVLAAGIGMMMAGAVVVAPAAAGAEAPSNGFRATVLDLGGLGLNVRAEATFSGRVVGTVDSGATIRIGCQADGPRVVNDVAGYASTTWDYLPDLGGYVSDAWVYTGVDGRIAGVPDCAGAGSAESDMPATPADRPKAPEGAAPTSTTGDDTTAARSAALRAAAILSAALNGNGEDNDRNNNGVPDDEEEGGNGGFTPNGF